MKKLLSLLLVVTVATLSAGCFGGNSNGNDETTVDADTSAPEKKELSRGVINGNIYESEYLGLKFTNPESWVFATDEEIAATLGLGADLVGADLDQILENSISVFDMMTRDISTGTNINISIEDLSKTFSTNITEKQYVEALKQQLSGIEDMTVDFSDEIKTVTLGENDYTRLICTTTVYGVEMTQVYYVRKIDKFMCGIVVTIMDGYSVEDIEAMFE